MYKAVQQRGEIAIMPIDLVEFHSTGKVLVIGSEDQVKAVTPHLSGMELITSIRIPHKIEGWLGHFSAEFESETIAIDLVLDMLMQPINMSRVLPLGYFAPGNDAQALAEALQQLPDLIGIFDKPRYFDYKPSICAHSRRQLKGCQQCTDACPADAITSDGDRIAVNPALCQGCGSCSSVCPSGAIRYALPTLDVSINRLRSMLTVYFDLATSAPQLVIYDITNGDKLISSFGNQLADTVVAFSIEEIGALGMPFWLTALAYGAANITIWDTQTHDDHDWAELKNEVRKTNELLTGLGFPTDLVRWFSGHDVQQLISQLSSTNEIQRIEKAHFAGIDDKRRMITIALEHLYQHAPQPVPILPLNSQHAFGEIGVDTKACTLCHSCVSVCPMGAVLDGGDKPQLNFVEDLCVQCGLCQTACPENAISLNPRYVFNREQTRKVRLLHQEPVFNCIACDKPFATVKMIETMTEKLKSHAMFQGDALNRLKMCEDCRVKAIFKDA